MTLHKLLAFIPVTIFLLGGCESGKQPPGDSDPGVATRSMEEIRTLGAQFSTTAQAVLLANVGKAISEGGPEYAVQFCNIGASGIMDSLSEAAGATIGRISNRNRNPANRIDGQNDILAWNYWTGKQAGEGAPDTVIYTRAGKPYYYKPIRIGMETCLQCHGSRSTEISMATLNVLDSLYPGDKAVNYRMGDLRGLWKIGFEQ